MNTKQSRTLRFLEHNEVFTLEEYLETVDATVSERTRYTNLSNAVCRGQAYRIRRRLYASNLGIYRDRVPNVFLVASKATPDALVSHHSALELHGVAHTPLRTVYYTSRKTPGDFEVRGYRFVRIASPNAPSDVLDVFTARARSGDVLIPVTSRERTLVDCLRNIDAAGGLEELLRSLGGFTSIDTESVLGYLALLNSPTIYARVGWTAELFKDEWELGDAFFEALEHQVGRGTYRLVRSDAPQRFVARWRLYVPENLPFEEWVRG